jgi:tetratricopeptide (TPR) repeat protein/DNA-binding XRE family transcriptional regulator
VGSQLSRGPRSGIDVDGAAVRQARLDAGLSLAQVAGADLTRQAVHLIEKGKVRPTRRSLGIIARRLGVPEWTLLAGNGGMTAERALAELELLCQRQEYQQAADQARHLITLGGCDEVVAYCHHFAGQALYLLARPTEALPHLQAARRRFSALGNPAWAAESTDWEAMVLHMLEDASALRVARKALRTYQGLELRLPETETRMLEHLGTICLGRRDFLAGRGWYEAALEVDRGIRDLSRMGRVYHGLGMCHYGMNDCRTASTLLFKAITLYEAEQRIAPSPMRMGLPRVENDLGLVVMQQGDLLRAEDLFQTALHHYEIAGIDRLRSHTLLSLGELRERQGRLDEALEFVVKAIEVALRHGEMVTVASGYRQLGELYAARGDHGLADSSFQRALGMLQEAGVEERLRECMRAYETVLAERRRARRRSRGASA